MYSYLNILLHSSIADLLLNPYYCPPDASTRHVKYLRPRSDPSELILWQQGLMPRSMNRFAGVGGGGRGGLSVLECDALSSGTYARMLNYWNLHMSELPDTSRTRLELLSSKHRGRLFTISVPHQIMRRTAQHSVIPPNVETDDGLNCFSRSVLSVDAYREKIQNRAAGKIQLWYRSLHIISTALESFPKESSFYQSASKKSVREILRSIVLSILTGRVQLKQNISAISKQQVSCIVDDIVSMAVDYCSRRHFMAEGSMKVSFSSKSVVGSSAALKDNNVSGKKKSLAAKFLKKGKKKFSKMKNSFM